MKPFAALISGKSIMSKKSTGVAAISFRNGSNAGSVRGSTKVRRSGEDVAEENVMTGSGGGSTIGSGGCCRCGSVASG